ncbi:CMP-N-acetylneuraminate-poly-alpha-2,8-sialyltransferase-like isoform X2 [Patiria miniata]|uniref:Uncharacterized protein n=1 Tax=Patiria miniata TaxID=46514 RepID=A0A914BQZ8_PATMI|nr:CMP-N-acetylneuraminate-poly-alpha-2,8-sialyltransferase-like isoform X2 [Patiria miniata]
MARWVERAGSTGRYCGFSLWIFRACSRISRSRICRLAFLISVVAFGATILFFLGGFHATETRQEHVYSQELRLATGRPTQPRVNTASSHRNTSRTSSVELRRELGDAGNIGVFSLTKNNAQVGTTMRFSIVGANRNISQTLWNYLPEDANFKSGQFQSCSVVGSSGILRGSGCGKEIDRSQYVVRFNVAPVEGFEADVGSKTNFTTLNPSYVKYRLNGLKTQADRSQFGAILKQFIGSKLWLPAFGVSGYFRVMQLTAAAAFDSKMVQPLIGHPEHHHSVTNLWRKMAMRKRALPSTGMYFILSLFDVCDQINVFGFWPYETAINGSEVPYHYHNAAIGKKTIHDFDTEFQTLVNLYEQDIIKMHLGSCLEFS